MYGGICTFGRSRQLYYAADALGLLPDAADDAEQHSEQALEAYSDTSAPDWSFSDQAGSYADPAIARIMKGEIDGAAAALEPVLELEPGRRIHGIISSADQVHKALGKAESSQAVTDLQLELERSHVLHWWPSLPRLTVDDSDRRTNPTTRVPTRRR